MEELAELVNLPQERLDVEHKTWLSLDDHKHRADLARHIAAIANHGGGYIVFGLSDDGSPAFPAPSDWVIDHDRIASITKKYLDPSVHCDIAKITSTLGNEHPIIIVPSHEISPVCAKANGPDNNGKPVGIVAGTYYKRKPGPESAPIISSAEWHDIIRRCALHDKAAILAAVSAALADSTLSGKKVEALPILKNWAAAADAVYLDRVGAQQFQVPLRECRIQLSYRLVTENAEQLPSNGMIELLRRVAYGVDQYVKSGWSLFYVFGQAPLAPYFTSQNIAGVQTDEFVEANYLSTERTIGFDFWRASPEGLATTIREFWEDTPESRNTPRTVLDPKLMARTIGEAITHAELFGAEFSSTTAVEFNCRWHGLKGRHFASPNSLPFHSTAAEADFVEASGTWPIGRLASDKAEIVAELGGKVARVCNWTLFTKDWVTGQMPNWVR